MYGTVGSLSGIIHMVAKQPVISTVVAASLVALAITPVVLIPPKPVEKTMVSITEPQQPLPKPVSLSSLGPVEVPMYTPPTKYLIVSCSFKQAKHITTLDNICKANMDTVALTFKKSTGLDKLLVIGSYTANENPLAGRKRALNTKSYLTVGEGGAFIEPDLVQIKTQKSSKKTVEVWFIPNN